MKRKTIYIVLSVVFIAMILILSKSFMDLEDVDKLKEIEKGNYSYIDDEYLRKHLEIISSKMAYVRDGDFEWVYRDVNGDGVEDLILLEKYTNMEPPGNALILDIITIKDGEVVHVFADHMDIAYYCQLCDDGLLYYEQYYGRYDYEQYILFRYDKDWNGIFVDGLTLYYLLELGEGEEEFYKGRISEDLDMEKEQLYFWEFQMQGEEKEYTELTREEWINKFYELFGRECKGEIFKYYLED